ncbi:MAG: tRNA (guanine37-N1)-methyltransferase [Alphaproteobacteria bacterium]
MTAPVFDIITFLPDLYPGHLGSSILGTALEKKLWHLNVHNIRDFSENKHRQVDDKPAGGGSGMVLRSDIAAAALDACIAGNSTPNMLDKKREIIYASPSGTQFDHKMAKDWSQSEGKIFLCGRFEGVDQRVLSHYNITEVSIGDFILCGGDSAVQMMLEATIRLIPNVVGNATSTEFESFHNGLLEHEHYTLPRNWCGNPTPDILLSGNHEAIAKWRHENSKKRTKERRPDLWDRYCHESS